MERFARYNYQPVLPMGRDGRLVTGSKKHLDLVKKGATDGTVLLKNDGTLPLQAGEKICLFGRGAGEFLFGGGGSGSMVSKGRVALAEGLEEKEQEGKLQLFHPLIDFYQQEIGKESKELEGLSPQEVKQWNRTKPRHTPVLPEKLYQDAVKFGGVAVYALVRYSAEEVDRSGAAGDFSLYPEEKELLDKICRDFKKVVVILNVCGMMGTGYFADKKEIGAVLYPLYGGHLAGRSLAEILLGEAYPSGHLQHTLARSIEDYPSTVSFRESETYVNYEEDIFVGYRYFETFCPEKVVYPYGFGLSYTSFAVKCVSAAKEKNTVALSVSVKNTGKAVGREVVQLYLSAPQGKLGKAAKVLAAFGKTKELKPGEEQVLKLSFDLRQMASFDDLGKVQKTAFVLEKGEYKVELGVNVRDTETAFTFALKQDEVVKQCKPYMAPVKLEKRLLADGSYEKLPKAEPMAHPIKRHPLREAKPEKVLTLDEATRTDRIDAYLRQFSDDELGNLLYGHTAVNASWTGCIGQLADRHDSRLPAYIPTADGPAGYRAKADRGVYATHLPSANAIAQTWDLNLARRIAAAGALEVKENNAGIWLTPAMNIHRSPLCGRNFEYYSEDPLATGLFGAATVKGIQSQKVAATIKHFVCNNKETNRKDSDSRVSQRALREIYLRGFEITVKKADPWALMTSYNPVNGARSSANWESINGVLRGEWHYQGVVMTDWQVYTTLAQEIHAGSDVKMPEQVTPDAANWKAVNEGTVGDQIRRGTLDRGAVLASAYRIFRMIGHLE